MELENNGLLQSVIKEFVTEFENKYNINIFFVCETNSRPFGVDVIDSDFDLKGFYLSHPSDCRNIIPKIAPVYKTAHNKINFQQLEYDVDVEFLDIREFAIQKIRDHIIYLDYILYSPTIYINKYPELIEQIKIRLEPSPDEFIFKFKNLHVYCEKSLVKLGECQIKKLLSALISGVQFFYVTICYRFPQYNIWSLIDEIRKKLQISRNQTSLQDSEIDLLENIFDLIKFYYEEKKTNGRKVCIQHISTYQYKFLEWLETRFIKKNKKKLKLNFDFIFFETWIKKILYDWLKIDLP